MTALSRAGVSIDTELLERYDRFIDRLGYTNRSEALRHLIRDELARADLARAQCSVVGVVALICPKQMAPVIFGPSDPGCDYYRTLLSTMQVRLDDHRSLVVVAFQGTRSVVESIASSLLGMRHVLQGAFNVVWEGDATEE